MNKWFIISVENEHVTGPFMQKELVEMYQRKLIDKNVKVWGRSLNTWLTFSSWQEHLKNTPNKKQNSKSMEPIWHFAYNGDSFGPMTYNELMIDLKSNITNIGKIHLWTVGMQNWAPVFDFLNIINELGINQRQHPRADTKGTASIQVEGAEKTHFITKLTSISQGGVGISEAYGLSAGDEINIDIMAEGIGHKIKATAEVRYVSSSGHAGIKFQNISAENASSIIQFIKNQNSQFQLKQPA